MIVDAGTGGAAECDATPERRSASERVRRKGLAVNGYASTPYDTAVGASDFFYTDGRPGQRSSGSSRPNGGTQALPPR